MLYESRKLAQGTSFETTMHIFDGDTPGPVFMIVAGIHGREVGSIRAAQKLVKKLKNGDWTIERGTLIVVPIANRPAFKKRIRGKPDLNRTFPRGPSGRTTHEMSRALYKIMRKYKPAWYLDLHEANGLSSASADVLGQTLITDSGSPAVPAVRRVIKHMNGRVVRRSHRFHIRMHKLKGSSRTAAADRIKAKAVTVETCWSLDMNVRINYQTEVVRSFLREAGLI
ncbi:succinylglutamate desuccinylase/aspartoacylase family protein [Paenibacillus sp. Y412MC10]|uniref:succinylglutamate desuccinylase/aspartoacylase domain-containing protein n=1 Tax=Geobacillus sp. (strain Y412MC10) TaxID=481743 RepID=UPI0011A25D84|nr:succinylglutamate desuccinylase/aspartoacylase family protein [Paenibacillus sp. Y412MC10]